MTELLIGKSNDPGRRDYNEDRVDVKTFKSAGGLDLTVGVVADGVGGEERGEAAAQKAVDTVFDVMRASRHVDVPTMLEEAVSEANRRVHEINQRFARGACTLAIAAVHNIPNNAKLYVANVGDSRVYLCRQATEKKPAKLTQLTLDHSFANLMPIMGKLSKEAAAANPRADNIMRAIGPNPNVPIDLGFYVNTEDMQVANQRGRQGIPIKDGDSIVICSDGLIKPGEDGRQYCRDEEIIDTVNRLEGEKAAKTLVSVALGRDTDDNVSAVVIQMPNTAREKAAVAAARRPYIQAAVGAVGLIALASILGWFLLNRSQQAEQEALNVQEAEIAETAVAQQVRETEQAQEVAAFEATSTAFAVESEKANDERELIIQETVAAMAALNATACTEQNEYDFDVGRITFKPRLGETHTEGEQFTKELEAQWTVVNEGCPATNVRLVSVDGDRNFVPTFINSTGDGQGNAIFEGENVVMTVKLDSIEDANSIDEELRFVVEAPNGRDLELNNVNMVELKVPDDETWIVMNTPEPSPTKIVVEEVPTERPAATDEPEDNGASNVAAVPQTRATDTPNYSVTQTRQQQVQNNNVTATARVADATRKAQVDQAANNQTRDAFNQRATATVRTQQTENAQRATIQAQGAKATTDARATEWSASQTRTRQAQSVSATQTQNARPKPTNTPRPTNTPDYNATKTVWAQQTINARPTATHTPNYNATKTVQARQTENARPKPTNTPRPTHTPRPVSSTNTPRPANTPVPVQPTTPPQTIAVTPQVTDTSCVQGGNGFVNGTFKWTGQLGANQWFAIRIAPQGQRPQDSGTYVKNNITSEGQTDGRNWAITGFGTGLAPGDYSWTVALLDNGNPIAFAPQTGCFANSGGGGSGGTDPQPPAPTQDPRCQAEGNC